MTELQRVELAITQQHAALCVRTTVERAAAIGDLLLAAKGLMPHGSFSKWCRRLPFSGRSCREYLQIAKWRKSAVLPEQVSINAMLKMLRMPKERPAFPDGEEVSDAQVSHCDCRRFEWPELDVICTDPPWRESWPYDWLARLGAERLREGGLLMVQCGVGDLAQRIGQLGQHLVYRWTLAMVYESSHHQRPYGGIVPNWRPVLVFSKGKPKRVHPASDVVTVRHAPKVYHPWQQPAKPFFFWLSRWTKAGAVIADPFAGSGSIGVAARACGDRVYLGTDCDGEAVRTARHRLAGVEVGWRDSYEG